MREFIEWRSAKSGIPLLPLRAELGRSVGGFDVIMAWHVFEHLRDPESVLDDLLARLAPGGRLYTNSGFHDASCPQHHLRSDWEQVLSGRGLILERPDVYCLAELVPA